MGGPDMSSISVCMIVKNEEKNLKECLGALKNIADEIIVVDTGSSDNTVQIAKELGTKVYSFTWVDDFAKARNYALSLASCDYIYSADADERIDKENLDKFISLKKALGEVEIVQMYYSGQLSDRTVYNYDKELRPKLFKRVRSFTFEGPVHETLRTDPLVYDSDIEIHHEPSSGHADRDLKLFEKAVLRKEILSSRLLMMYARELMMAGTDENFENAREYFIQQTLIDGRSVDDIRYLSIIAAHAARIAGDSEDFLKFALKEISVEPSSEMCCELGEFYLAKEDFAESSLWYYNAAYETESILDSRYGKEIALSGLSICNKKLGKEKQ